MEKTIFIVKVLILSAVISILIKYGGSSLSVEPTIQNVLLAVLLPSLAIAIALLWRSNLYRQ